MRIGATLGLAALTLLFGCEWNTSPKPTTTPAAKPAPAPAPKKVPTAAPRIQDPMIQIAAHHRHVCATRKSGSVVCWGKNEYGQLGNGSRQDSARVVKVAGLNDAKFVAVGRDFSCALRRGGTVACWGNNEDGQLGDGKGASPGAKSLRPVAVSGLRGVKQLVLGQYHGCALTSDSKVRCWGNGGDGQIGSDRQRAFATPLPIERLAKPKAIASGASHVCALETNGKVKCWGRNTEGQLGDGVSGSKLKAVDVKGIADAKSIVSGYNHVCVTRRGGAIACWGDNKSGQLGAKARGPKQATAVAMTGLKQVAQLAAGDQHTCARLQSGRVMCWGLNDQGQLGHTSSVRTRNQPTAVRGVADAVDMSLGLAHTCAVRKSGEVACWGAAADGALGPHRLAALHRVDPWG